jgi:predicted dithiol-disulfide oxidoreductase (DUF899 family)
VRIDKEYRFDTEDGPASLADLFRGRSQLLVYHFMFGPEYTAGCPDCSMIADGFNGFAVHLANHDVMLWAVSRAPLPKLQAYKRRMGWTFPWASSLDTDFNFDFNVSFTEAQERDGGIDYNYRRRPLSAITGDEGPLVGEQQLPGMSAFALDAEHGIVYHTYSAYERGLDVLWGVYQWLDRAPKGRNEERRWRRRRDEYPSAAPSSQNARSNGG